MKCYDGSSLLPSFLYAGYNLFVFVDSFSMLFFRVYDCVSLFYAFKNAFMNFCHNVIMCSVFIQTYH